MKISSPTSTRRFPSLFLVIFLAAVAVSWPAAADVPASTDEEADFAETRLEEAPHPFNGSFSEWSVRAGPHLPSADQAATGWTADIGFRNSFPMYLGDNRIAYNYSQLTLADRTLQIHGLHATFAVHPLYLAILSRGFVSHFLSSLHVELGVGPRFGVLAAGEDTDSATRWGVAGSLGVGFDLPITNPDSGQGLWVNAVYRRNWSTLSFELEDGSPRLHDHGFFFGLAWRINGIVW